MPRFFNTLTGRVEDFQPMKNNEVRMYACGPTVYDYGHIGNFRTFVFVDLLRRFLRQSGFKLKHAMNITDVDDKIIRNAAERGISVQEYTQKYEKAFLEDTGFLNIERPEQLLRATEHIEEMAEFIKGLVDSGHAYRTEDGSYYFRIATFPSYGKLSKKDFGGIIEGARVDVDEYDKDNARDFALWKAPKAGEAFWETKIGPGRPGWHIECSTMAMKYLGETFDIHLGGEDLIFPHHENEIAQSEALTGKLFARFWMHARFLLVEGEKMSKSLGNFYTVRDLILKGHKPSALRFLLTSVPYRKQLNFTFDGLKSAAQSIERLRNFKLRLETSPLPAGSNPAIAKLANATVEQMNAALADDLNTAEALGKMFDMVREANAAADAGQLRKDDAAPLLKAMAWFDAIFAVLHDDDAQKMRQVLQWAKGEGRIQEASEATVEASKSVELSDARIDELIAQRQAARKSRNFARADEIRNELASAGIILEDTKDGVRWKKK
ncbi:MAG TPA: cysteine--tRNA ligase [Terriglobales bacterium]|nr:cysteine--tRNA ligase [Terriglobales bacterium]